MNEASCYWRSVRDFVLLQKTRQVAVNNVVVAVVVAGLVEGQQTEAGLPAKTSAPERQPACCHQGKVEMRLENKILHATGLCTLKIPQQWGSIALAKFCRIPHPPH